MSKPEWVDADAHVLEPRAVWSRVDTKFKDRILLTPTTKDPGFCEGIEYDVSLDGLPIPIWIGNRQDRFDRLHVRFREKYERGAGCDQTQYLKDLDREGLSRVVIYPTLFLWATWIPQLGADFSAALARAYNDWITDFCSVDKKRLRPVAVISLHDVKEAMAEVERCAKRDFVGVFVRPNPLYGRTLGHPDYHPVYALMQDLGLSVGIHEGQLSYLPTLGSDRVRASWAMHCVSHPFEQMAAMLSLLEEGVYDKFPKLNFLFLEAGTALWVPYWVNRLEAERKLYRSVGVKGAMPAEIFARQCFVTSEVDDPWLPQVISCLGDERLLMSTDYPHMESPYPNSVKAFQEQKISAQSRDRIGKTNAYAAYPRLKD
jgi:uncharacterized protein